MHEAALSRAALPAPTVCLGIPLRPYSLGHELWLIREGNKLVTGETPMLPGGTGVSPVPRIAALPAAVLICSQSWDKLGERRRFDPFLSFRFWLWKRAIKRMDCAREFQTFLAYRAGGLLEFPISEVARADRGASRLPGCPFILRLQQWLMREFRLSEAAAWDYPVGLAKMRWAAHWEGEGGLDIYNAHEAESDAQIEYWESRGGPGAMKSGLSAPGSGVQGIPQTPDAKPETPN